MLKWSFDDLAIGTLREDGKALEPNSRMERGSGPGLAGWYGFAALVVTMMNAKEARIAELEAQVERLEADAADARSLYCGCDE